MENPIRILHVFHGMNCGGAENMIMNLYRKIDRTKIQFDFLVHTSENCFFDDEIRKLGGRIYNVPYFNGINYFQYKTAIKSFLKLHHEYKIIHGHLGSCAHIYLKIAKKTGLYTIAHTHATYSKKITFKNIVYRIFAFKTRRIADFFFGCSFMAGVDRFGKGITNSNRFKIINNAIDSVRFIYNSSVRYNTRNMYDITNEFVVGHVGRFCYDKNHTFLLDIFNCIQQIEPNSKLILAGEGDFKEEIKRKAKELNIDKKIVFTGVVPNIEILYHAMDCFVFPSHNEGLGIAVVEAQTNGLPCFITQSLPIELNINPNLFRLSLYSTAHDWAEFILKNSNRITAETAQINVANAGYDISDTILKISNFYIKTYNRMVK